LGLRHVFSVAHFFHLNFPPAPTQPARVIDVIDQRETAGKEKIISVG
jgi:hypothetical protein